MPSDEKDKRHSSARKSRSRRQSSKRKRKSRAHKKRSSGSTRDEQQRTEDSRRSSPAAIPPNLPPANKEDELGIKPWVLTGRRSLLPPGLLSTYSAKTVSGAGKDKLNNDGRKAGSWSQKVGSIDVEAGTGAAHAPLKLDPIPGVIPGLEVLHGIKALFIRLEKEPINFLRGYKLENRYSVFNTDGQRIYFAGEISTFCNRFCLCCAESRPFVLNVFDATGETIFRIERRCNCLLCCFGSNIAGGSCLVYMRSTTQVMGRVLENCSCSTPSFSVYDKDDHYVMSISGPSCSSMVPCYLGGNVVFHITDPRNGTAMGSIMKRFAMREVLTDSNDFGFSILSDTDEVTKAVLIGAVFCIDFTFFGSEPADSDTIHWKWGCWKCSLCTVAIDLLVLAAIVIVVLFLLKPEWFKIK